MKVDETKFLKKIIALASPMLTTENIDRNTVQINATAIVSLCEIIAQEEQTTPYIPSKTLEIPYLPNTKYSLEDADVIFGKAKEEQRSDK